LKGVILSAQQTSSEQILKATEYLCKYAQHVPPDKVDWKPDAATKSVREILEHTIEVNHFFKSLISGAPSGTAANTPEKTEKYEKIIEGVRSSGEELAGGIRNLKDTQLGESRQAAQGNSWEVTRAIATAGTHIAYHWGQIGYLQTTWGDAEDHF
jgi:uncharacterized damage-inducible protein DinB